MRARDLLVACLLLALPTEAHAHPHVWVDAASEMLFDDKGRMTAVRHHWRFDEAFSAYALQGLDTDRDGAYSAKELEPLARENVESLKDFDYFTFLSVGDYQAGFSDPRDYHLELMDGRLLLHFTLPLAAPLLTRGTAVLQIYDPEYYVDFSLPSIEAVRLDHAPSGCRLTVHPAAAPDAEAAAALAAIGADQRQLPAELQTLTAGTENTAEIQCGGNSPSPADPGTAIAGMAGGDGAGDLTALPGADTTVGETKIAAASPDGALPPAETPGLGSDSAPQIASAEAAMPIPRSGLLRTAMAKVIAWQTAFNHDLTRGLAGLKDGGAFWWLGGISFLYGIVHAAGPGHGKVVVSSYMVANESRVRRGVLIAFASALAQALVAIGVIGLMAAILNMTSMAIDSTARYFEAGSFALVALLGLYLLARKSRAAWSVFRGGDPHAHHHHGHGHDAHDHHHDHEHRHHDHAPAPSPRGALDLSGAAAAILAVGLRPCSGALVVLVFALAQGVFWAGIAATLLMALGTALTVAVLAVIAVGFKGMARRMLRVEDHGGAKVMLGLELAAAALITLVGSTIFLGLLVT